MSYPMMLSRSVRHLLLKTLDQLDKQSDYFVRLASLPKLLIRKYTASIFILI